jgi:hypothetical protein
MVVPVLPEFVTILLNVIKKEGVQKPDMVRVFPIEKVEPLKTGKEGPPAPGKVAPSLEP